MSENAAVLVLKIGFSCLALLLSFESTAAAIERFSLLESYIPLNRENLSVEERAFLEAHPVIRVAIPRGNFEPRLFINDDGEITGSNIVVLQRLTSILGLKLEPVVLDTWPQTLTAVKDRQADLVADIGYTSERDQYLDYTVGISPDPAGIVGRKDDNRLSSNPTELNIVTEHDLVE